jgi:hypothetical protein
VKRMVRVRICGRLRCMFVVEMLVGVWILGFGRI